MEHVLLGDRSFDDPPNSVHSPADSLAAFDQLARQPAVQLAQPLPHLRQVAGKVVDDSTRRRRPGVDSALATTKAAGDGIEFALRGGIIGQRAVVQA